MSIIIGINAYHADSSACIVRAGRLVAAAEEERFRRIKHWAGFPTEAVRYCIKEAGVSLADVGHVAINTDPKAHLLRKIVYGVATRPSLALIVEKLGTRRKRLGVAEELRRAFPGAEFRGRVHQIEHHLSHLASAYLVSPFEQAVAVSVDGFGDFSSAAWGYGTGGNIAIKERAFFPHSLGIFYQAITQYLGFMHYGDEYKVMGLAPYGKPRYLDCMRQLVHCRADGLFELDLRYFRHHTDKVTFQWEGGVPLFAPLFSDSMSELIGFPARTTEQPLDQHHKDLASSAQAMYEEAFFNLLRVAQRETDSVNIAIAGGCGMNSVANGKIRRSTAFRHVYVQSAAGDAGGAIGAAFVVSARTSPAATRFQMNHAYWGPEYSNAYYERLLTDRAEDLARERCVIEKELTEAEIYQKTAMAIAQGLVVGWFQGRMEWGPRALGNRSILADPRRANMKEILNLKIKRRESFRPFAPSILREAVHEWFEENDDVPFMMQVFQIREDKRSRIPAVTHVDGSGRLQTVDRGTNPRYYGLIEAFCGLTGVPIVLNTSFNENEPVVCKPDEALDCFLRTKMDVLVLGTQWIRRTG